MKQGPYLGGDADGHAVYLYEDDKLRSLMGVAFWLQLCRRIHRCPVCDLQGDVTWKDMTAFADILCPEHRSVGYETTPLEECP